MAQACEPCSLGGQLKGSDGDGSAHLDYQTTGLTDSLANGAGSCPKYGSDMTNLKAGGQAQGQSIFPASQEMLTWDIKG